MARRSVGPDQEPGAGAGLNFSLGISGWSPKETRPNSIINIIIIT